MGKGLTSYDNKKEEVAKGYSDDPTRRLWINAGDIAFIRFLTDVEDVYWHRFHRIPQRSRMGKTYSQWKYCAVEDEGDCKYCSLDPLVDKNDVRIPRTRFFFWVYVKGILHKSPAKDGSWKEIKYAGDTYYKEEKNRVQIFETGPGQGGATEAKLKNWAKRFGTLTDRDYEWVRQGTEVSDTSYDLIPVEKKTVLKDEEEIKKGLMDLEELIKSQTKDTEDVVLPGSENEEVVSDDIIKDIESIFSDEK